MKRHHWGNTCFDLVAYALGLIVVIGGIAAITLFVGGISNRLVPEPPPINAPLLEIVRWCETNARESYTVPVTSRNSQTGRTETKLETRWRDAPDKFISCMQAYEYIVSR